MTASSPDVGAGRGARVIEPAGTRFSGPPVSTISALQFWYSFLVRHYWHGPDAGLYGPPRHRAFLSRVEERMERQALASGPAPTIEVERIDGSRLTPDEFQRRFVERNRPVVLEGVARDWAAVREWSPEFLADRYGDQVIPARLRGDGKTVEDLRYVDLSVRELVENIAAGGAYFGGHLEDLWHRNPELRDGLDLEWIARYLCRRRLLFRRRFERVTSLQMFLSGSGTRSGYHCAGGVNLFVMVHGQKRWTLVDPRFTKWMHPITRRDMFYVASPIRWDESDDQIAADGFPLYRYIPKHVAHLVPGDALFVPQWWWHAVETLGPSIGVATRTMNRLLLGHTLFSSMWMASPSFLRITAQIMGTGWGSDAASGAKAAFERDAPRRRQSA